jgi:hypothetical protein
VDVAVEKFIIFAFGLVVVVADASGIYLEFAGAKDRATIADQRAA